jgi:hypothetical protein
MGKRRCTTTQYLAVGAVVVFAAARIVPFARARVGLVLDSFDYLDLAKHESLFGRLSAHRPPGYLLVLSALGENRQLVTWFQLFAGIAAWSWLAFATARSLRTRLARGAAFVAILVLGSSLDVVQWDRLIGTESLSISLGVAVVAAGLWWWGRWPVVGIAVTALLVVGWALVRDANAIVVGVAGMVVLVVAAVRRTRALLVIGTVSVAVAIAASVSSNAGARWRQPTQNVITFRVLTSPERTDYFLRRGLPVSPVEARRIAGRCTNPVGAFMCEKVSDPAFYDWIEHRARPVYVRSWFAFPATTLWEPLAHGRSIVGTRVPLAEIAGTGLHASHADAIGKLVFPRSPPVLVVWLALLAIGLVVLGSQIARSILLVGGALVVLTYVHMWVVWTGDAVELERHGLGAAVQLQVGLWLLSLGLLDALLLRFSRAAAAPDAARRTSRSRPGREEARGLPRASERSHRSGYSQFASPSSNPS